MAALTIELTDEQLVALLRQLPPARRQRVLAAAASDRSGHVSPPSAGQAAGGADSWWAATQRDAEAPLKRLAAEKGFDWDRMDEAGRKALAADLVEDETPVPLTARSSKPGR
jgi:hypothetical protein